MNFLSISVSFSFPIKGILKLLLGIHSEWKKTDVILCEIQNDFRVLLYSGYSTEFPQNLVFVKIFKDESLKDIEIRNLTLCEEHNIGPSLIAIFNNGIVFANSTGQPLNYLSSIEWNNYSIVASSIGNYHRLATSEKNTFLESNNIFHTLQVTLASLRQEAEDLTRQSILPSLQEVESELNELNDKLNKPDIYSIIYCHGNLKGTHIILNDKTKGIHLKAFEFAGYNFQAFELAQYFMQLAGSDLNTIGRDEFVPAKEFQIRWIRHYLSGFNNIDQSQVSYKEVTRLYNNVQKFMLVFGLQEVTWSMVHREMNSFDSKRYGMLRYEQYKRNKCNVVSFLI